MSHLTKLEKRILRQLDRFWQRDMPEDLDDLPKYEQIAEEIAGPIKGLSIKKSKEILENLAERDFVKFILMGSMRRLGRPRLTDKAVEALQRWWRREKISAGASILIGLVVGLAVFIISELIKRMLAAISD